MRRDFLKLCGLAGLGLAVPRFARELVAKDEADRGYPGPYYVVFNASGGWDTTYLMDPKGVNEINRLYKDGDILTKGTVIAEFDEGDLRRAKAGAEARVAQLESRVATARDNLEIAKRTYERYASSAGADTP